MYKSIIKNKTNIAIGVIILIIGAITAQNILLSELGYETSMKSFYNNYLIFKNSYFHLLSHQNLYILSKDVQVDLFKYSPTFALLFGVFAILPDFIGLFLWNLLNAIVFYSIWKVSFPLIKNKLWILAFILLEFITNAQNSQSNGLMAGLIILGYVFLEKKNIALAALMIVLSVYVKLFGAVAFVIFLFYPDKWKAFGYSALWFIVLFALPLIVISPSELILQYQNWGAMLVQDKAVSYSPSVMGWLKSWFGVEPSGMILTGIGVLLFLTPLIQFRKYKEPVFKQLILASVLIWVVIFNHKAESPTFIIAISGVAIWFFSQPRNTVNIVLLALALVLTQLSPTDLFPSSIKSSVFIPYVLKVVPIILIWIKLLYDTFQTTDNS